MLFTSLIASCFLTFGLGEVPEGPTVALKQGKIKGHFKKSYNLTPYVAFEGIPYAKAPIADFRFKDPQPAGKWEGTLPGDKQYVCPLVHYSQGIIGNEDCLYLYVYVPGEKINKTENLAVVVNIHGGAFVSGSPTSDAAPDYIMTHSNVIYVTFNYRLGILGFLSTEDEVVSGNMGLKDQTMALKWIKENIGEFGGNPESVTITGLSAGGASVHYHYLSPMSKGLFARGFSQSGNALNPWALTEKPLEKAKLVARNVSCETESTQKMVECFKSKPVKDLIQVILVDLIPIAPFGPVVEKGNNSFLPDNPYKLLKEGKVHDVPWINSNVKEEGILSVGFYFMRNKIREINENWNELMTYSLDLHDAIDDSEKNNTLEKIRQYYFGTKPLTEEYYEPLVKVHTDRGYLLDSELAIRTQAKVAKSPIYYYLYGYVSHGGLKFKKMKPGASHGSDAALLFKWWKTSDKLEKEDEAMMFTLTAFLAKYATKGVPEFDQVVWRPVDSNKDELDYLDIESPEQIKMTSVKELAPTKFWSSLPIKQNAHIY